MDKEAIEEIRNAIRTKAVCNCSDICAEAIYNAGYHKIPEQTDREAVENWLKHNAKSDPYFQCDAPEDHWDWVAKEILSLLTPGEQTYGCEFCNYTGIVTNQWDNTEDCPVCHNKPIPEQTDKREALIEILYGGLTYKNYLSIPKLRHDADLKIDQILSLLTPKLKVLDDGQHLISVQVTRREMLAMPIEVRHAILERQSVEFNISHPEYYFNDDDLDKRAMQDKGMMD